jgi:hypothetical protein
MGRKNEGEVPPSNKAPAKRGRGSGRGRGRGRGTGKARGHGLVRDYDVGGRMDKPDSVVEDSDEDGLGSPGSEGESNEEGGSGRREIVTIEVPVAMWVSLIFNILQENTNKALSCYRTLTIAILNVVQAKS